MKKLLMGTAAVALAASLVSSPASAQVKLDVGGYTKMYLGWLDQDEASDDPNTVAVEVGADVRNIDVTRDTEIHFSGETTLDNGLTVGFHTEATTDTMASGAGDSFGVQESYAYFSGAWGRVNLGAEDGATYLLQVAAPSADANIDGIRQWINPINHGILSIAGNASDDIRFADIFNNGILTNSANGIVLDVGAAGATAGDVYAGANAVNVVVGRGLDYSHDISGYENKVTYMTPVFNGFQAGVSYTPELGHNGVTHNIDDEINDWGSVWELAARYEGQFDQLGFAIGGGWSHADLEKDTAADGTGAEAVFVTDLNGNGAWDAGETRATLDDREAWNVGVDFNWMAFGLGAVYMEDNNGVSGDNLETQTWVVGVDYTTGPFKLGASYLNQETDFAGAELEQDRWTGGVVYTYGPGMTFRGSISFTDFDENLGERAANTSASDSADATSFLLGTQIDF